LLAQDAMINSVISITGVSLLKDAAHLITQSGISGVPVVGNDNQLLGVIGERDIILALDLLGLEIEVKDVMNPNPVSVRADQPLVEIFEMFRSQGLRRVIVCDEANKVIGIIGRRDLLRVHMDNCMEQNRFRRNTMRRPSSSFELGPLVAQLEQLASVTT